MELHGRSGTKSSPNDDWNADAAPVPGDYEGKRAEVKKPGARGVVSRDPWPVTRVPWKPEEGG